MPILKNDAMLKTLNAINEHQFTQWKTYAASPTTAAELEGEVAVLGSLFWVLSDLIHDVQIYEQGANKEVYAKFTEVINTRFNAEHDYGYTAFDPAGHDYGHFATGTAQPEDRKNGFRNGVQWVEQELAEMVLAP